MTSSYGELITISLISSNDTSGSGIQEYIEQQIYSGIALKGTFSRLQTDNLMIQMGDAVG